jgi:hypothetical protein
MKSKLVLLSLVLLPWGTLSQAWGQCPCSDKETLSINEAYNKGALAVTQAVLPRLTNPEVIAFAKLSAVEFQATAQELDKLSIDAGIDRKPNGIEQGFIDRSKQALTSLSKVSGAALDESYMEYASTELLLLLTAFDTYFIPKVTTPAMKAWTAKERPIIFNNLNTAQALHGKVLQAAALAH